MLTTTPMEEMMMLMMKIRSNEISSDLTHHHNIIPSLAWKLYENPFYMSDHHKQPQQQDSTDQKQIHRLHLPISTRKIAASFWDLTFIKPLVESELEMARAQISELKAEIECERKARKKMESLNKRLARELSEERKGREALERVCEELAKELSSDKAEINRMKQEMHEERKMLRVAEVIREERVQMKLAEAKIFMEEKFSELEISKRTEIASSSSSSLKKVVKSDNKGENVDHLGEKLRFILAESSAAANSLANKQSMVLMRRRACTEIENPHIKRGIKGFVEFPKVIRAIGCRSSKHLSSKLECQKAQLKVLLKQKETVRLNRLIAS